MPASFELLAGGPSTTSSHAASCTRSEPHVWHRLPWHPRGAGLGMQSCAGNCFPTVCHPLNERHADDSDVAQCMQSWRPSLHQGASATHSGMYMNFQCHASDPVNGETCSARLFFVAAKISCKCHFCGDFCIPWEPRDQLARQKLCHTFVCQCTVHAYLQRTVMHTW